MKNFTTLALASTLFAYAPTFAEDAPKVEQPKVEVLFSPKDHVDAKLISLIDNEQESIKAAVYCLTHRGVIKALLNAKSRGVDVELIIDPFTIKARAPLRRMTQSGMAISVWDPQAKHLTDSGKAKVPLMHNKFCLFKGQGVVWTGSFNFTSEGSNANQENVIVINDKQQVPVFEEQFQTIKNEGCRSYRDYLASPPKKKKKVK